MSMKCSIESSMQEIRHWDESLVSLKKDVTPCGRGVDQFQLMRISTSAALKPIADACAELPSWWRRTALWILLCDHAVASMLCQSQSQGSTRKGATRRGPPFLGHVRSLRLIEGRSSGAHANKKIQNCSTPLYSEASRGSLVCESNSHHSTSFDVSFDQEKYHVPVAVEKFRSYFDLATKSETLSIVINTQR